MFQTSLAARLLQVVVGTALLGMAITPGVVWAQANEGDLGATQDALSGERLRDDGDARLAPDAPSRDMLAAAEAAGDYRIDALVSGYKWPIATVTYSFYEDSVFAGTYYGPETGVREVSGPVKTNVRALMAWMGTLINVNLVEVAETSSTVGQIRIMLSDSPSYAYAYYPSSTTMFHVAGDVHLSPTYDRLGDTNGFQHPPGKHGYVSLIHEIGHALGLKHPHSSTPNLPADEDNHSHTVMSYNFPGASPGTPMGYDLLALQYLYGAHAHRAASDTYAFTRPALDQYAVLGVLSLDPSTTTKQTMWDTGGVNVLDLSSVSGSSSGYRLDLNPLGWITTWSGYQTTYFTSGVSLGPGVAVQKVVNSVSSDTIYASPAPNAFAGYASDRVTGSDVIYGADGADVVDLSGYLESEVTQVPSGNDLVLGLGGNGSVTVKGYYTGNAPAIVFDTGTANQLPQAAASASPPSGVAPLPVAFSSAGSFDADGTIVAYAWAFGDGSTSTSANPSHTYQASGAYTATLAVTDDRGATASQSLTVVVSENVLFVGGITMKVIQRTKGPAAQATVSVVDASGQPVIGATVTGRWSGLVTGSPTRTTNNNGRAIFKSRATKKSGTITFTVTAVSMSGFVYDPARNVETTDSIVMP